MRIIDKPRASGKTTDLIYLSEYLGYPIVCLSKEYVLSEAKKLGKNIEVHNAQVFEKKLKDNNLLFELEILVDEIDAVIKYCPEILNCNIHAATLTSYRNI